MAPTAERDMGLMVGGLETGGVRRTRTLSSLCRLDASISFSMSFPRSVGSSPGGSRAR